MDEEVYATPDDDVVSHGIVRQRGEQPSKPPTVPEATLDNSSVQPQHAFEVFAGKVYQTTRSDKRISSGLGGTGSSTGSSVLVANGVGGRGSVAKGVKASTDPVSRYFRLRAELEDLETDLAVLNHESNDGFSPSANNASSDVLVALRNELLGVRQRLNQAGSAPALRTLVGGNSAADELGLLKSSGSSNGGGDGSGGASAALLAAVENLKVAAQEAGIDSSKEERGGKSTNATGATFELYVNPPGSNDDNGDNEGDSSGLSSSRNKGAPATSRAARVAALEERMARVEGAVGAPVDDAGALGGLVGRLGRNNSSSSSGGGGGGGSNASLGEVLAALEARVARLEPETIAKARQELQPLQAALQQVLQEQKAYASGTSGGKSGGKCGSSSSSSSSGGGGGGGTSIDERSAVAALFQRTQAIDEYGPMLPGLIGRLRSLQGVHEASINVINRLSTLEQSRQEVASAASRDREALALLASNLSDNLSQVTENVAAVDARLAGIAL